MILFTAAVASAVLNPEMRLECVTAYPAEIPLDEAALLLNDLIGGPCVYVMPAGAQQVRGTGVVLRSWYISVQAAEIGEAYDVIREVEDMAAYGRLSFSMDDPFTAYRLHGGELMRLAWTGFPGSGVAAIGDPGPIEVA